MADKKDFQELADQRSKQVGAKLGSNEALKAKMRQRAEQMQPKLVTSNKDFVRQEIAREVLPEGHTLSVGSKTADVFAPFSGATTMGGGGGAGANFHTQRPYLPEFDSPERQFYPHDRAVANKYWRMFYKYDPVFGTAVDMYSQMMVSEFDITLENQSDQGLKNELMDMADEVFLLEKLQSMVKEYLVTGEALPHCFFDDSTNKWSYIGFHDPDYIDIQDSPIIDMEPIINFIPDDNLRNMLLDTSPESQELRQRLPSEFVSKVLARQKIRLSPLNCSYIPRKLHPYDERGVSLASRMWRIWMVEDAVYNSTIQTFRRAAAPLRVALLGDPQSGWLPGPEAESNLQRLLMQAEVDPNCYVPETITVLADGSGKPIGDLEVGDELISATGEVCEVEYLKEEYSNELIELRVFGYNKPIRCTPNHRMPIWGTYREYKGSYKSLRKAYIKRTMKNRGLNPLQLVTADQVMMGDYFVIPKNFDEVIPDDVTPEMARLLGYYAAEGHVSFNLVDNSIPSSIGFSLHIEEADTLAADIDDIIYMICGKNISKYLDESDSSCSVYVGGQEVRELAAWLFENCGKGSHTKKLSKSVMQWPIALKKEFLKGYCLGDGCASLSIDKRKNNVGTVHLDLVSASVDLMRQVRTMLIHLGIYGGFRETKVPDECWGAGNDIYTLRVSGRSARELIKDFWNISFPKSKRDASCWWSDDDNIYVRLRSVTKCKYAEPQKVINLSVSGNHTYCVNNFGTKNSWLIYNYGVKFETIGINERAVTLSREHSTIEQVKLLALGLSKSFMTGETTFSSAKSGLQVFLRRLLSMRQYFENTWILPKFFQPIIQINDWTKAKPSEVAHGYRIKRTAQEKLDSNLYIKPKLKWKNKLDPAVDSELLQAYGQLRNFGFDISLDSVGSIAGLDWKEETTKSAKEFAEREKILSHELGALKGKFEQKNMQKGRPPGTAGGGARPPGAAGGPSRLPGLGGDTEPGMAGPPGSAEGTGPSDMSLDSPGPGGSDVR